METKTLINTYQDLINYIQDNNLQDKKIIVGCQGYTSYFKYKDQEEYQDTYIIQLKDKIIIADSCYYYDIKQ